MRFVCVVCSVCDVGGGAEPCMATPLGSAAIVSTCTTHTIVHTNQCRFAGEEHILLMADEVYTTHMYTQ